MRVNPEKKEERERVALALLRATLSLAAAHGFASLGLREVSRAADIAPTSFYRHFADMEALGLALIEGLVGDLVQGAILRAKTAPPEAGDRVDAMASHVLSAALEDPELTRFILAERAGAIPSFREALRKQLSSVSVALGVAMDADRVNGSGGVPPYVPDGAVVLLLDACGRALERAPAEVPALVEHVLQQIHALSRGSASTKGKT